MYDHLPTRDEAWNILTKYVTTDHLQRHVLMVEGTMRHFARLYHEDEEAWGILGLLHDIDFELYPEEHLHHAPRILREEGFDEDFIRSVVSHGYGICSDTEPVSNAEKVLFTIDELTGLIYACALMRPSKSTKDIGMPLDEVIQETILGMRECADSIGLSGNTEN